VKLIPLLPPEDAPQEDVAPSSTSTSKGEQQEQHQQADTRIEAGSTDSGPTAIELEVCLGRGSSALFLSSVVCRLLMA
jgi:hypothetical protein